MWIYAFICAAVLMFVFRVFARRESATSANPFRAGWMQILPRYGTRADFTERGWVYRNLMIMFQLVALAALLGWWFTITE